MRIVNSVAAMSLFASALFTPGVSPACVQPGDLILAQAFLNHHYPDSLHVYGAIWEGQRKGILPMPDREYLTSAGERRIELNEAVRLAAIDALEQLGAHFEVSSRQRHAISMVLVERMHWARFLPDPATGNGFSQFNCDAETVGDGDLVVVTNDVVLHAIRTGDMSIARADALGILRLYGTEGQIAAFLSDFGEIGSSPLSTKPRTLSVLERFEELNASEVTQISIAPKETR